MNFLFTSRSPTTTTVYALQLTAGATIYTIEWDLQETAVGTSGAMECQLGFTDLASMFSGKDSSAIISVISMGSVQVASTFVSVHSFQQYNRGIPVGNGVLQLIVVPVNPSGNWVNLTIGYQ